MSPFFTLYSLAGITILAVIAAYVTVSCLKQLIMIDTLIHIGKFPRPGSGKFRVFCQSIFQKLRHLRVFEIVSSSKMIQRCQEQRRWAIEEPSAFFSSSIRAFLEFVLDDPSAFAVRLTDYNVA